MYPVLLYDYIQALVYGLHYFFILMVMCHNNKAVFFLMAEQSCVGLGILIFEVCRSHSVSAHTVGLLRASDGRKDFNVT
jgi:hypothetical protein